MADEERMDFAWVTPQELEQRLNLVTQEAEETLESFPKLPNSSQLKEGAEDSRRFASELLQRLYTSADVDRDLIILSLRLGYAYALNVWGHDIDAGCDETSLSWRRGIRRHFKGTRNDVRVAMEEELARRNGRSKEQVYRDVANRSEAYPDDATVKKYWIEYEQMLDNHTDEDLKDIVPPGWRRFFSSPGDK